MKTFADLKRDLKLGTGIEMVNFHNGQDIPERLQSIRYVVKVKSNGVELNKDKNATKGSLLVFILSPHLFIFPYSPRTGPLTRPQTLTCCQLMSYNYLSILTECFAIY